jgi:OmcA/MtrC family decaheme c-type cytochrome
MLTGGLGYSYNVKTTMPLTQTNLADYPVSPSTVPVYPSLPVPSSSTSLTPGMPNATGGLIVIAPNAQMVAEGYTGRRAIVEDKRCNACHQELGTFTEDAFHAGQRNDGTTCSWCHTPNRTSGGWSADSTSFVHAIHAAAKRTEKYTWHAISPTEDFSQIHYPGVLSQCETCHLPNTYDFSAVGSASAVPNRQYRTVANGTLSTTEATYVYPVYKDANGVLYVTPGVDYGAGFNATTGADAAATTLVTSPTATVCFACHDSPTARNHMANEGGSLYSPRSAALPKAEQCMLCHGPDKVANIKTMHAK